MVPVQAMVIMLYSSGVSPHDTITAGKGYIIVPGLKSIFAIFIIFVVKDSNINQH